MLEVFNNLFMSIAEQMGYRLQNTAYSVNIKERLDFSCAIFDAQARLIANAPHMPVHLGSMGESVRTVMNANRGRMMPGDAYVVNDPYHGGTHLPDVTVITRCSIGAARNPVLRRLSRPPRRHRRDHAGLDAAGFADGRGRRRAVHQFQLVKNGELREQAARDILGSGRWPARNPDQNIADMRAQIAANERACRNCCACAITSAWTWCVPTWGTCRTTPRKRCAA